MFYVDITDVNYKAFYYNMNAKINEQLQKELHVNLYEKVPHLNPNSKERYGDKYLGKMVAYDRAKMQAIDIENAHTMAGILASGFSEMLAEEIAERARLYCPVDTGQLVNSIKVIDGGDGSKTVLVDCPYAWYVNEFTWIQHKFPQRAKFLDTAIWEVYKEYGII